MGIKDNLKLKKLFKFILFGSLFLLFVEIFSPDVIDSFLSYWVDPASSDPNVYLGRKWMNNNFYINHILTIAFSRTIAFLVPYKFEYGSLVFFFGTSFLGCSYDFLKDYIDHPYLIFILAPFSGYVINLLDYNMYAQLFSASLFILGLKFWFQEKEKIGVVLFFLSFLAHFWEGGTLISLFGVYLMLYERKKVMKTLRKHKTKVLVLTVSLIVILIIKHDYVRWFLWATFDLNSRQEIGLKVLMARLFVLRGPLLIFFPISYIKQSKGVNELIKYFNIWLIYFIGISYFFPGLMAKRLSFSLPLLYMATIGFSKTVTVIMKTGGVLNE